MKKIVCKKFIIFIFAIVLLLSGLAMGGHRFVNNVGSVICLGCIGLSNK